MLEITAAIDHDNSDTDTWHFFDTILFALHRKIIIDIGISDRDLDELFPLMSPILHRRRDHTLTLHRRQFAM